MTLKRTLAALVGLMLIGASVAPYVSGAYKKHRGQKAVNSICDSLKRIAFNEGLDMFPMAECKFQFGRMVPDIQIQPGKLDVLETYNECLSEAQNISNREVCDIVAAEKERSLYQ